MYFLLKSSVVTLLFSSLLLSGQITDLNDHVIKEFVEKIKQSPTYTDKIDKFTEFRKDKPFGFQTGLSFAMPAENKKQVRQEHTQRRINHLKNGIAWKKTNLENITTELENLENESKNHRPHGFFYRIVTGTHEKEYLENIKKIESRKSELQKRKNNLEMSIDKDNQAIKKELMSLDIDEKVNNQTDFKTLTYNNQKDSWYIDYQEAKDFFTKDIEKLKELSIANSHEGREIIERIENIIDSAFSKNKKQINHVKVCGKFTHLKNRLLEMEVEEAMKHSNNDPV